MHATFFMDHVISHYPVSQGFKALLEAHLGRQLDYLCLAEIRHLTAVRMFSRLRSLRGEKIFIAIEEQSGVALRPLYEILAVLTRASHVEVVMPDLSRVRITRFQALLSTVRLVWSSAAAAISFVLCAVHAGLLKYGSRIEWGLAQTTHRVLHINCNLWFGVKAGGSVGHISGVLNAFLERGLSVDFATAGGRLMVRSEATIFNLSPPDSFGFPIELNHYCFHRLATSQLRAWMSNRMPDFLYQRLSFANFSGVLLSRYFRLPLILEYNGSEVWVASAWGRPLRFPLIGQLIEDICLKHAHIVVTVSDVLRSELVSKGVDPSDIVVYPNCIDPRMFDPAAYGNEFQSDLRRRCGIPSESIIVGFLGTFGAWHGIEILASAISEMVANHSDYLRYGKVHFLLIGDGTNMPVVRKILSDSAADEFCTLTGLVPQKEAPGYLSICDILVSPHLGNRDGTPFFGSPTKLFEYMAMGKPIVASDLDQIGAVLSDSLRNSNLPKTEPVQGETRVAILTPPGDVLELSRCIRFLVEHAEWRKVLGGNARKEVLSKYTWAHHVQAILKKLERSLASPGLP